MYRSIELKTHASIEPVVTTGSRVIFMNASTFTIGQLAVRANCKVETVHYYEKSGLMPNPPRSSGGHRIYGFTHAKRLKFIRRSRELGFSIEQIRTLLRFIDEPDHSCGEVKVVATAQAREVQLKIDDLKRLKSALDKMVSQCKGENYPAEDCAIIDSLYV